MRKTSLIFAFGLMMLASRAEAKQWRYIGPHPLSADAFCYIEAPHVHVSAPYREVNFRLYDGAYYFVGDPVAYGWEGERRHVYHGHHPIHVETVIGQPGIEFCYIDGPHYHYFAPPQDDRFVLKGGVYWYVGKMPGRYRREREVYGPINTVQAEIHYSRPVVTIEPPSGYVDLYFTAPHVGIHAVGPAPHFVPPAPRVAVIAPRPHVPVPHVRPIGVVVPAPHVGVYVPAPSVTVRHESRVVVEGRGHHDNGKHLGHYKNGKRGRR